MNNNNLDKIEIANILKKFSQFSIGPVIGAFISFLTVPIITRLILPEEFGKSAMYTLFSSLSTMILLMGLDQSYVREFNEIKDKVNLIRNALFLPSLLTILSVVVINLFSEKISILLFGSFEPLVMILIEIGICITVLRRFLELAIRMEEKAKTYSFLSIFFKSANFVILLVFLFIYEKSFRSIILAQVGASFFTLCFDLYLNKEIIFSREKFLFDKKLLKRMLFFGMPILPATLLSWVLNSMDKVALRTWSNFNEIGIYSGGFKIVALLAIFQQAFTTFWVPLSYRWYNEEKSNAMFEKVSLYVSEIMAISFVTVVGLRGFIILLLGPEYRNAVTLIPFLLFMPVMYTISETTVLGISFKRKTIYQLYVAVIATVVNLIGNYLLVPKYGALGASMATAFSFTAFFWARTLFSREVWFKFSLKKYIINTFIMMGYAAFTLYNFKYSSYLEILIIIISIVYNKNIFLKIFALVHLSKK